MSKIPAKVACRENKIYCQTDYRYKDTLKKYGFSWDKEKRLWCTPFVTYAKKLFPESESIKALEKERIKRSSNGLAPVTPGGMELKPFQFDGVLRLCAFPECLLADDMGLGKTVQAIAALNTLEIKKDILIICPASLKINWKIEIEKWMVRGYKIQIISGKTEIDESADIHIINYDIAMKKSEFLHSKKWQVIICDESHYLKNASAQRTKAILGEKGKGAIRSERKWFLTGTPLLNRPIELFAPLRYLMPLGFTNKEKFSVKYCAAGFDHMGYWDDKGASNTDELNTLLHEYIMLRRAKSDVLTDLPDKTRQVIELEPCGASKAESKILKGIDGDFRNVMSQVKGKFFGGSDHMMTIRRKTGLAKFKPACEVIDSYIESGEKLVVFAVHTELIQKLYDKYKEQAVILTGGTSMKERDRAVRAFQNEPDVKIFIGNIQAAGVGITLTAASNALMLELPWSPSEVIQAEDRLHRLTQENAVLIKYLVFPDTIDSLLTRMLSSKTKVIREILD